MRARLAGAAVERAPALAAHVRCGAELAIVLNERGVRVYALIYGASATDFGRRFGQRCRGVAHSGPRSPRSRGDNTRA